MSRASLLNSETDNILNTVYIILLLLSCKIKYQGKITIFGELEANRCLGVTHSVLKGF